jgi:hypothetical protein
MPIFVLSLVTPDLCQSSPQSSRPMRPNRRDICKPNNKTIPLQKKRTYTSRVQTEAAVSSESRSRNSRARQAMMYRNDSISQLAKVFGHFYVERFLKDQIDDLNSRDKCWHQTGTKGLETLLRANISQSPNLGINISQGLFNVSTSGNNFTIDLTNHVFAVNGLTELTYNTLSVVHSMR